MNCKPSRLKYNIYNTGICNYNGCLILQKTGTFMEVEEILQKIKKGEGLNTEFKKARNDVPADIYETLVSFSNTVGGTIILGVTDDGEIEGIERSAVNKILKNLTSAVHSSDLVYPPFYMHPELKEINECVIIVVLVPVSSQVHKLKNKIYIREYESDVDITDDSTKVGLLYQRKSTVFTENNIIPGLTLHDLAPELFDKARNLIQSNQGDHPWLSIGNNALLKEAVLWRKDFMNHKEGLTLAAALLFGKDTTIQSLLPAYKVEVIVRRENKDRWDDRLTLRTNLLDTYMEVKSFINKHLPARFYTEKDQRIDLRDRIFREVVGNVIVHREYNSSLATEIVIDQGKLEAKNPNKPHFIGPIDLDSFNPYPKNPNIRKFFTALGWADEIGSGIRNTKKYLPLYVEDVQPVFIENHEFTTIIPLRHSSLKPYTEEWLKWLELDASFKPHLEESLKQIILNPDIESANWERIILHLVPGWNQKGAGLEVLDWPKKQPVNSSDIKKVPGYHQKSIGVIHKKVRYYVSILSLTAHPLSLESIMHAIGYANKKTFRDNYIKPLMHVGFIQKTKTDKLSSPKQKYQLTEKGKLFLGQLNQ